MAARGFSRSRAERAALPATVDFSAARGSFSSSASLPASCSASSCSCRCSTPASNPAAAAVRATFAATASTESARDAFTSLATCRAVGDVNGSGLGSEGADASCRVVWRPGGEAGARVSGAAALPRGAAASASAAEDVSLSRKTCKCFCRPSTSCWAARAWDCACCVAATRAAMLPMHALPRGFANATSVTSALDSCPASTPCLPPLRPCGSRACSSCGSAEIAPLASLPRDTLSLLLAVNSAAETCAKHCKLDANAGSHLPAAGFSMCLPLMPCMALTVA